MIVELKCLEELEPALSAEGFFGRAGYIARVFISYRCSEQLRRQPVPAPPEPCRLPPVAVEILSSHAEDGAVGSYRIGAWERSWNDAQYAAAVDAVRAAIRAGEVYQTNLVQHLSATFDGDPRAVAKHLRGLRALQPRPLVGSEWAIVSASPELFLARRGNRVLTSPIKGTRPAGVAVDSPKDLAEHLMIVDLERNDLARVCRPGSVRWRDRLRERQLAGVTHLVSTVEGILCPDTSLTALLAAVFPGGSVTGAPKVSALDLIASLEPVGRGAAMGALGTIQPNGDLDLALTIRTFAIANGRIHFWVGGGIVWDSSAADEIAESWTKARPLLTALAAGSTPSDGRAILESARARASRA